MGLPIVLLCGNKGAGKNAVAEDLARTGGVVAVAQADVMKRLLQKLFGFPDLALWGPSEEREKEVKIIPCLNDDARQYFDVMVKVELRDTYEPYAAAFAQAAFMAWFLEHRQKPTLTARYVLQTLGTEVVREHLDASAWWKAALRVATTLLGGRHTYTSEVGLVRADRAPPAPFIAVTDGRFPNEIVGFKQNGAIALNILRPDAKKGGDAHRSETELKTIPDHFYDIVLNNKGTLEDLTKLVVHQLLPSLRNWGGRSVIS